MREENAYSFETDPRTMSDCDITKEYPFGDKPFGNLLVLRFHHKDSKSKYWFICKCIKCNTIIDDPIRFDSAIKYRGRTNKCKCIMTKSREFEDLVAEGKMYGYLKPIEYMGKNSSNQTMWKCLCTKCNKNYSIVSRSNLLKKKNPVRMCRECANKYVGELNVLDRRGRIPDTSITVLERHYSENSSDVQWLCQCDCGEKFIASSKQLSGANPILSCPKCYRNNQITHGMTDTNFYEIWSNIKQRCYNPNNPKYPIYGGRGIKMCDEWYNDFNCFKNDMYESYLEHQKHNYSTTIDRIDNDGNYCKENCRWATYRVQSNNKSYNHRYEYKGNEYTIDEFIDNGIAEVDSYNTIHSRLIRGTSINEAILDLEGRRKCINPISFFDSNGNEIQDPYNNRH